MKKNAGFTLLELSIVLVIIGLIVGGITVGSSMIRAAELRAVIAEKQKFQTATMVFSDKYFAVPGDMPNATDFWGNADTGAIGGDCAAADTDEGTGTQTCNGDGDGKILTASNEMYRVFEHLANAGLIEGSFSGVKTGTNVYSLKAGVNVPGSKLSPGYWGTRSMGGNPNASQVFNGNYQNNYMIIGTMNGNINALNWPYRAVFIPEEAWGLDNKIDDGKPGTGNVVARSYNGWNNAGGTLNRCTLAQSAADNTADYMLRADSVQCALIFLNMY